MALKKNDEFASVVLSNDRFSDYQVRIGDKIFHRLKIKPRRIVVESPIGNEYLEDDRYNNLDELWFKEIIINEPWETELEQKFKILFDHIDCGAEDKNKLAEDAAQIYRNIHRMARNYKGDLDE